MTRGGLPIVAFFLTLVVINLAACSLVKRAETPVFADQVSSGEQVVEPPGETNEASMDAIASTQIKCVSESLGIAFDLPSDG